MLEEIGDAKNVAPFIEKVKARETRLMGFGHRIYKNYDPRAKIIKHTADERLQSHRTQSAHRHCAGAGTHRATGRLLHRAQVVPERRFLFGHHLPSHGLPGPRCSRCSSAIPRTAGWLAQWGRECLGPRAEDRAPAPSLYGRGRAYLRAHRVANPNLRHSSGDCCAPADCNGRPKADSLPVLSPAPSPPVSL